MNKFSVITVKERSSYILTEYKNIEHRITVEHYDDQCDIITFNDFSNIDLLSLFHAGIKCGHDSLKTALHI